MNPASLKRENLPNSIPTKDQVFSNEEEICYVRRRSINSSNFFDKVVNAIRLQLQKEDVLIRKNTDDVVPAANCNLK